MSCPVRVILEKIFIFLIFPISGIKEIKAQSDTINPLRSQIIRQQKHKQSLGLFNPIYCLMEANLQPVVDLEIKTNSKANNSKVNLPLNQGI